jgi:hypothetical protein
MRYWALCHVACSALHKSLEKAIAMSLSLSVEYDRATRVRWSIPTYVFHSSSTRNKLLTCLRAIADGDENEQQALNANDCSMNSRCAQAAITRLLKEQRSTRRLLFRSGEAKRSRPA